MLGTIAMSILQASGMIPLLTYTYKWQLDECYCKDKQPCSHEQHRVHADQFQAGLYSAWLSHASIAATHATAAPQLFIPAPALVEQPPVCVHQQGKLHHQLECDAFQRSVSKCFTKKVSIIINSRFSYETFIQWKNSYEKHLNKISAVKNRCLY